jgi:hypothetical protein
MPAKSFIEASRAVNANILILGTSDISSVFKPGQMDDYLEYLIQGLDKTQNLYVGGDGVFSHNKFKRSRKFNYIPSLKMLDEILKELN